MTKPKRPAVRRVRRFKVGDKVLVKMTVSAVDEHSEYVQVTRFGQEWWLFTRNVERIGGKVERP